MAKSMTYPLYSEEYFMNEALKEAKKALGKNEVPVGAVVVCSNRIIARAHNFTETLKDVTAHAEMQAFTAASGYLGGKYLNECTLFVTLEPCIMCAGAAYWAQLKRIVYGAEDPKRGFRRYGVSVLHPSTELSGGVMERECGQIVTEFFKTRRG